MLYIDTSALKNPYTGIGKTVNYLINSLRSTGINFKELSPPGFKNLNSVFYYNVFIPQTCRANLTSEDIFLIPNNLGKYFRLPHQHTWIIIHDLIPLSRFGYKGIKRLLYRLKIRQIRKAEKIITISETVKKQLTDILKIPPEKIDVVYWPTPLPNIERINTTTYSRPFFLSIGTGEPRKYVESIIKIWGTVAPDGYDLLLFGGEWQKGSHLILDNLINKINQKKRIKLLGKVSEAELYQLYKNASGFIFPSLEEGFGLPPLEALSVGTPIILPKTPINYELYGQVANLYSIGNIEEFRDALNMSLKHSNKHELIQYSSNFSLDKFNSKLNSLFNAKDSN